VLPLHTLQAAALDGDRAVPEPEEGDADGAAEDAKDAVDSTELPVPEAGAEGDEAAAQPLLAESGITLTPDLPAVTFKWKDILSGTALGVPLSNWGNPT
jgi:hypothetical protein